MSRHIGELNQRRERFRDCGNCYGNGCWACGMTGRIETEEGREDREDAAERRAEADRDDRLTHPERFE